MEQGRDGLGNKTRSRRDEELDLLAGLLDDAFRIPGTRIRFGLDALLGLIPGVGDAISGLGSLAILYAGWRRGQPRAAMGRMPIEAAALAILAVPLVLFVWPRRVWMAS